MHPGSSLREVALDHGIEPHRHRSISARLPCGPLIIASTRHVSAASTHRRRGRPGHAPRGGGPRYSGRRTGQHMTGFPASVRRSGRPAKARWRGAAAAWLPPRDDRSAGRRGDRRLRRPVDRAVRRQRRPSAAPSRHRLSLRSCTQHAANTGRVSTPHELLEAVERGRARSPSHGGAAQSPSRFLSDCVPDGPAGWPLLPPPRPHQRNMRDGEIRHNLA